VPDLAICKINIRLKNPKDLTLISTLIHEKVKEHATTDGITFELHEQSIRPPKPFNKPNRLLFEAFETCAQSLGHDLKWQPSGGVCDGNTLSAAGLPTMDTLGAVGGHMHTHDEYIFTKSLSERARLTACFLMQMAENPPILEKSND
jgi:glutamate carboxypeptidase